MIIDERNWDVTELLRTLINLKPTAGAEIGVYNGDSAIDLMKFLVDCRIYLIDPWRHLPEEEYPEAANYPDEVMEARYQLVTKLIKPYNAVTVRKRSCEAINDFEDNSLDFVYIDANHKYEAIKFDVENWHKKVRPGGIVSGHDFCWKHFGVIKAVSEHCSKIKLPKLFILRVSDIWLYRKGQNEQNNCI
jgi:predicted O-methyltransferase YrrM